MEARRVDRTGTRSANGRWRRDDTRVLRVASIWSVVAVGFALQNSIVSAADVRTQNFMVTAPTAQLANEIAQAAEQFRHDLAVEWLGRPLPDWRSPCPIVAHVNPTLGAGGRTSFVFNRGMPGSWDMEIQGNRERVLDSVLPHEVTHTIFATHFGRPLPRWADEGACTTVEHRTERHKQEEWLKVFLKTERGIPFNRMFAMTEYPGDILPLYSQGYSVARYLIAQGGKPKFVDFVGDGMDSGNWSQAVQRHYGYDSLGDLQLSWVDWVVAGSEEATAGGTRTGAVQLAAARSPSPEVDARQATLRDAGVDHQGRPGPDRVANVDRGSLAGRSWYARREGAEPSRSSDTTPISTELTDERHARLTGPERSAPPVAPSTGRSSALPSAVPSRSDAATSASGWRSLHQPRRDRSNRDRTNMSMLPQQTQRY